MPSSEAIIQLRELVGDARVAMVTSRAPGGELHSRPLTLAEIDDDGALVFMIDASSEWVAGLAEAESVNVAVVDDRRKTWVSVAGTTSISDDQAAKHRLWNKAAEAFFPDGLESPNLRLLNVRAESAEYWDAPASRVKRLADMAGALLTNRRASVGDSGTIDVR